MYSVKSLDYASVFPAERKQLKGGEGRKEEEEGRQKKRFKKQNKTRV